MSSLNNISSNLSIVLSPSPWTSNTNYINYNNVRLYANSIQIYNSSIDAFNTTLNNNTLLYYQFDPSDLSKSTFNNNLYRLNINNGTSNFDYYRNCLLLSSNNQGSFNNVDWSTYNNLSIVTWFKGANLANNDTILNFNFLKNIQVDGTSQTFPTAILTDSNNVISTSSGTITVKCKASSTYDVQYPWLLFNGIKTNNSKFNSQKYPITAATANNYNSGGKNIVITASSYITGNDAYLAFDNDFTTGWVSDNNKFVNGIANSPSLISGYNGEYLRINVATPIILKYFDIKVARNTRGPKSFRLYGSNDNTNWNLIQENNNIVFENNIEKRFFIPNKRFIIGSGYNHTIYMHTKAYLYGAGVNSSIKLGESPMIQYVQTFTHVFATLPYNNGEKPIDISLSYYNTMILLNSGKVFIAGNNQYSQFGNGYAYDSSQSWMWENNRGVQKIISDIIQINSSKYRSLLLKRNGTVLGCGANTYYELCNGTNLNTNEATGVNQYYPTYVLENATTILTNVVQVCAGDSHTLFLKNDGSVVGNGYNQFAQLSNGVVISDILQYANYKYPTTVLDLDGKPIKNIIQIAAGRLHSVFLKDNGTVLACGNNEYYQLGNSTNISTFHLTPPLVTYVLSSVSTILKDIVQISAGSDNSMFLKNDGAVLACGKNSSGQLGIGNNNFFQGFPTYVKDSTGTTYLYDIEYILCSNGGDSSFFITKSGIILACGDSTSYRFGTPSITAYLPTLIGNAFDNVISATKNNFMFINNVYNTSSSINNGLVLSCGDNTYAQFANTFASTQVQTNKWPTISLDNNANTLYARQIHYGFYFALFLLKDATVLASGRNNQGQLGNGNAYDTSYIQPNRASFVKNSDANILTNVIQVSAGYAHSLFLQRDGTVWACGNNTWAQLGNGNTTNTINTVNMLPDIVLDNDGSQLTYVIQVSAAGYMSFFLKSNGTVLACGDNQYSQLGNGNTTDTKDLVNKLPTIVLDNNGVNLTNISQISAGYKHTLFLRSDGKVLACGNNTYSQLGNGNIIHTKDSVNKWPTIVLDNNGNILVDVVQVRAGIFHSLFLKNNGMVLACGDNRYSQLGNGNTTSTSSLTAGSMFPSIVLDHQGIPLINVKQICTDSGIYTNNAPENYFSGQSYFLLNNDRILSCGYNQYAHLANGNILNTNSLSNNWSSNVLDEQGKILFMSSNLYVNNYYNSYMLIVNEITSNIDSNVEINDFKLYSPNATLTGLLEDGFSSSTTYTGSTGNATATYFSGYNGEYIMIDFENSIKVQQINIYPKNGFVNNAPGKFRLFATNSTTKYANNDYAGWNMIYDQSSILSYTYPNATTVNVNATTAYRIYALVVQQLAGNSLNTTESLNFNELEFIGTQLVNSTTVCNIKITNTVTNNTSNLAFQINDSTKLTIPYTNDTWNHIIWNINNTSANSYVKLNNGNANTYTKVALEPGSYTNIIGSTSNIGMIYLSDFRIYTGSLDSNLENQLYNNLSAFKILADESYLNNQIINLNKLYFNTSKKLETISNATYNGIVVYGTITATTFSPSDIRLKTVTSKIESALDKISQIDTFKYVLNNEAKSLYAVSDKIQYGVSAQDVQNVLPEAVSDFEINNKKYLTLSYDNLIPLLIESIKELKTRIEILKQKKIQANY